MIDNLPSYQKWRHEALLVMAKNYWKLDDIFQAEYTLDFIIGENYSEEIVQKANALKERIQIDVARREAGKSDTTEIEIDLDNMEDVDQPEEVIEQ